MKRYALLAAGMFIASLSVKAQEVEKGNTKTEAKVEKPARDFVMLQFTYEGWMKPDSIATKGIGRGFNGYICYDFPIKKSHFSFAAGLGIGTSNIYLNNMQVSTDSAGSQATYIAETKDYKRYKVTTAYLEAPFELRYFGNKENRNRGFKAAVGLRAGTLIGAHTKGRLASDKTVEKINSRKFYDNWRVAGTVRLGWGNFSLMGTYNLNTLYKENSGPEITPYSIGICLTGL